ncbi:hypothetical protein [Corynebacterium phocae]|uniref:hypothetical protein n=1 Tax=Corynebacterium phocae TaxID=161895 RepID=UPI00123B7F06|nr:hypothetical protein [Corynebacterium phocae]KAA8723584.1 hypothetical protein F4V58_06580 [Corynebacterium phocae]
MMDIYAALAPHLAKCPGIESVYVNLPHDARFTKLPAVHLQSAGPARRLPATQGLGVDVVGIDIDLYVPESMWQAGRGMALAEIVRRHTNSFRAGVSHCWDVSRPEMLPVTRSADYARIGMTAEIAVPAF